MTTAITAGEAPACPGFDAHPRIPRLRLPPRSCDAHHHIFGPYADYPLQRERSYTPPEATLADYRRMCRALGIERSVLVHPSIYGTDLASLLGTLESCRDWMRGVAVVDASVDDETLALLDRAGVRGVRFNALLRTIHDGSSEWPLSYHNVNLANMGDDHGTDLRRY